MKYSSMTHAAARAVSLRAVVCRSRKSAASAASPRQLVTTAILRRINVMLREIDIPLIIFPERRCRDGIYSEGATIISDNT